MAATNVAMASWRMIVSPSSVCPLTIASPHRSMLTCAASQRSAQGAEHVGVIVGPEIRGRHGVEVAPAALAQAIDRSRLAAEDDVARRVLVAGQIAQPLDVCAVQMERA